MKVGWLKKTLGLSEKQPLRLKDRIAAFISFWLFIMSGMIGLGTALIVAPAILFYSLYISFFVA